MIDIIPQAAAYAAVIAAVVEAIRARVAVDGWRVLVLAGVVALALAALFAPATTLPELLTALRLAAFSWLLAVGGDAWLSKLATKSQARLNTIVTSTLDDTPKGDEP